MKEKKLKFIEFLKLRKNWNKIIKNINGEKMCFSYFSYRCDMDTCYFLNCTSLNDGDYDKPDDYIIHDNIKLSYYFIPPKIHHDQYKYSLNLRKYILENITNDELKVMMLKPREHQWQKREIIKNYILIYYGYEPDEDYKCLI